MELKAAGSPASCGERQASRRRSGGKRLHDRLKARGSVASARRIATYEAGSATFASPKKAFKNPWSAWSYEAVVPQARIMRSKTAASRPEDEEPLGLMFGGAAAAALRHKRRAALDGRACRFFTDLEQEVEAPSTRKSTSMYTATP